MRKELIAIVMPVKGVNCVHFTSTKLQGNDLWIPLDGRAAFGFIKRLMVVNGVARSVVSMDALGECGKSTDYKVTYNTPE